MSKVPRTGQSLVRVIAESVTVLQKVWRLASRHLAGAQCRDMRGVYTVNILSKILGKFKADDFSDDITPEILAEAQEFNSEVQEGMSLYNNGKNLPPNAPKRIRDGFALAQQIAQLRKDRALPANDNKAQVEDDGDQLWA